MLKMHIERLDVDVNVSAISRKLMLYGKLL
ncbi:hypothetical protein DFO55_12047 [Grimontella sp. AG753]|nr:hypothetical protein DFO55_12047 [Grimontella sp. AG753]